MQCVAIKLKYSRVNFDMLMYSNIFIWLHRDSLLLKPYRTKIDKER